MVIIIIKQYNYYSSYNNVIIIIISQYENFDYSLNVQKLMNIRDSDLENLLKSYNVTQKALDEMVASVQEWYQKQPHLPQGLLRK